MTKPPRDEIEALIRSLAAKQHLDAALLVRQCEVESAFDQDARSPVGAVGLFQLMPATAAWLHVDPHDWRANVAGAVKLMAYLVHFKFRDYYEALAAYNWGSGNMDKLLHEHPSDWRAHLPAETADYLRKILCSPTK
jgi:soluble lytic murein transglycosylase-like protein